MALQRLYVSAEYLDRRRPVTKLAPNAARLLQNIDTVIDGPTVARAPGAARTAFEGGAATQVVGMGTVLRRDGKRLLLWFTTAGVWTAQVNPRPAWSNSDYA